MDKSLLWFVFWCVVIVGVMICTANELSRASCQQRTVSFEDSDYGIIMGCMVKHNGRWLPLENIRGFDDKG